MSTHIQSVRDFFPTNEGSVPNDWEAVVIKSEDCQSYIAWNTQTREAIIVDPKQEDWEAYLATAANLKDYLWLGVIDTHTHADHISIAAKLAQHLRTSLYMHADAPSQRVDFKISTAQSILPARSAPVQIFATAGHTPDSVTLIWGPFLFGGDTILFGDTGRDDLPGGDPAAHYDSVEKLKSVVKPEAIVLPGHDHKGPRASTWATQLKINSSLTQSREDFIRESSAFNAPAPKLLKESLKENFK